MRRPELCAGEARRRILRAQPEQAPRLAGMDYVEVSEDQRTLTVRFIGAAPTDLAPATFLLEGGKKRVRVEEVTWAPGGRGDSVVDLQLDGAGDFSTYTLRLVADRDAHPVVRHPLADPCYDALDFSFKIACPSDADCVETQSCERVRAEPVIDYLAKDYASFRQLVLDRLALLLPDWKERHAADIGVALVEIFAYVGDELSYRQDAVATEAYLATAKQRISVARHARLVDYVLHEGCNARAWLVLDAGRDRTIATADIGQLRFATSIAGRERITHDELRDVPRESYEIFETLVPNRPEGIVLRKAHETIRFYTWGDERCCLPRGATRATLIDDGLDLCVGDVLVFEEVLGPETGLPQDADPTRRHAVRLVCVEKTTDPLFPEPVPPPETPGQDPRQDPGQGPGKGKGKSKGKGKDNPDQTKPDAPTGAKRLVEIAWSEADALPFALCISALVRTLHSEKTVCAASLDLHAEPDEESAILAVMPHGARVKVDDERVGPFAHVFFEDKKGWALERELCPLGEHGCEIVFDISVARGNVILVDHGETRPEEDLGVVPVVRSPARCLEAGAPEDAVVEAGPYRPRLDRSPLTHHAPAPLPWWCERCPKLPACALVRQDPREALGAVVLRSALDGEDARWTVRDDLLDSAADDRDFVVETDNASEAWIRFPRYGLGRSPDGGEHFYATYRIGNGPIGNVPRDSITTVVIDVDGAGLTARNPLPARGGTAPEPIEEAKLFAPEQFHTRLERAVVPDDYARLAERAAQPVCDGNPRLQRAAAELAWNGSWYEVDVALDPISRTSPDPALIATTRYYLEKVRRIGHDVCVEAADYVPLFVAVEVCVMPHHLRTEVRRAVLAVLTRAPDPRHAPGFFHPDSLTFDQEIYLSRMIATIQSVEGVASVKVKKFERLFDGTGDEIPEGRILLGPMEIARLDADPRAPEHGILRLDVRGGR